MKRKIVLPIIGLLVAAAAVAGILLSKHWTDKSHRNDNDAVASAEPDDSTHEADDNDHSSESHQVDYWVDGSLASVQMVSDGESAYPEPLEITPGKVFLGWDMPLSTIEGNTTATAVFYSTIGKKNCFALDAVYCPVGEEAVMYFTLCGEIDIYSADFSIKYDTTALELVGIENVDPCIITNHVAESGVVYCSMLLDGEVHGEIDCFQLVFKALGHSADTIVMIEVDDAATILEDEIVDAEYETVNGNVYILNSRE